MLQQDMAKFGLPERWHSPILITAQLCLQIQTGSRWQQQCCQHVDVNNNSQWLSRSVAATNSSIGIGPPLI
jgi:hypothetical protein